MIGTVRIRTGVTNSLELNGVDISHSVTGCRVEFDLDDVPRVYLDIVGADPQLDLEAAEVLLNEDARDVLIQMGWIPPSGER